MVFYALLGIVNISIVYHTISLPPSLTGCSLQDFTDSAYTSHDHRQNIILLSERARLEMAGLVRLPGVSVSCDWSVWGHVTGWSPLIGCRCPASPATWTPGTSASSTTPPATAGTGPSSLSGHNTAHLPFCLTLTFNKICALIQLSNASYLLI